MHRRLLNQRLVISAALGLGLLVPPALAETTPPQPAAAQPTLPGSPNTPPPKPGSPVVEEIIRSNKTLTVRKPATRTVVRRSRRYYAHRPVPGLDRPALAGVELVAPLPPPGEPPHITVPTPAFPLDSVASAYLTPPPPIVCHDTRRDRTQPDLRLYKEVPVECEPDNP